eukprot:g7383.t1
MLDDGKKRAYGQLFHYLQTRPALLVSLLSQLSKATDVELFIRVVVYHLFGDQFDSREERLLLAVVSGALRNEFVGSGGKIGPFMRATTPVTKVLQAYARRPGNMAYLADTLGPLFSAMLADDCLELEVRPHGVYVSLVNQHESRTGESSPLEPVETQDDAQLAAHPAVIETVAQRIPLLLEWCERFLARLEAQLESMPFGVRWICRQLDSMARATFHGATPTQVNSIVGGFVFLRYINPAVTAPDGLNLLPTKLKPMQRRNLVLVAGVLQKLSNGQRFSEKERFMLPCNAFLEANAERMAAFFARLIDVDNVLAATAEADLYLEHVQQREETLALSVHDILRMHVLVHTSSLAHQKDAGGGPNGSGGEGHGDSAKLDKGALAVHSVLAELGDPPADADIPSARSAGDLPCTLLLNSWSPPVSVAAGAIVAAPAHSPFLSPRTTGRQRKVSVWDRLEAQHCAVEESLKGAESSDKPGAGGGSASSAVVDTPAGDSAHDHFSDDDGDRLLKRALAAFLRHVPLERAIALVVGAAPVEGVVNVSLMQLLAAAHRIAEEEDATDRARQVEDLVRKLDARRGPPSAEEQPAVLADDAAAPAPAVARPILLGAMRRSSLGHKRGGSDTFRFIEAPDLHERLVVELMESLNAMLRAKHTLSTRLERLARAAQDVQRHHEFLLGKIDMFRQYLDAVRAKASQGARRKSRSILFMAKKAGRVKQHPVVKYSHKQLCDSGAIVQSDINSKLHKAVMFTFTQPAPGMYQVNAKIRGLAGLSRTLLLEELLEQQARNRIVLDINE